jgi:hypothetical protein
MVLFVGESALDKIEARASRPRSPVWRIFPMLAARCKSLWPFFILLLCTIVLAAPCGGLQQSPVQGSSDTLAYFPPDLPNASFFSAYLNFMGEPSLLDAAKDTSVRSIRMSWLSGQHGQVVTVRLLISTNGSGQITTAVASGSPTVVQRMKIGVSAADVEKLLRLVEQARFWSMRSTEQKSAVDSGRRSYELDGTAWIVEGVRSGSYHCVYRRSPEPSPFTEIGRYLAKDLAKLDDSVISIGKYVSPSQ